MKHDDFIKKLFKGNKASITAAEAVAFGKGLGMKRGYVDHLLSSAFTEGTLRRQKIKKTKNYEYRLASRYPDFGKSYAEEQASKPRKPDVIELCRKNSWQVEMNIMINEVRHA